MITDGLDGLITLIQELIFGEPKDSTPPNPVNPGVLDHSDHIGKIGMANTDLRPCGNALLIEEGVESQIDCISQTGFIEKGERIKIMGQDGPYLVVQRFDHKGKTS